MIRAYKTYEAECDNCYELSDQLFGEHESDRIKKLESKGWVLASQGKTLCQKCAIELGLIDSEWLSRKKSIFKREFLYSLATMPIDDGYNHTSEYIIKSFMNSYVEIVYEWLCELYEKNEHPFLKDDIDTIIKRVTCDMET